MLALAFYNLHCLTLLFLFHLHVYNGFSLAAHLLSGHIMVLTDFQRPSYTSLLECFLLMVFRSIPSFALVCRMVIHLQTSGLLHGIKLKVILLNVVIRLLGCLAYITPFYFYFHIPLGDTIVCEIRNDDFSHLIGVTNYEKESIYY